MKNRKTYFIAILLSSICCSGMSQAQPDNNAFVVVTFTSTYKISQHAKQQYYWIIPVDSLTSDESNLSRLFVEPISQNTLVDCENGIPFDPRVITANSSHVTSPDYLKMVARITEVVDDNKKVIQKITKKWTNGQEQKIVVYATPIQGRFCSSSYHIIGQERTGYKGLVYLPISDSVSFKNFWDTPMAKLILTRDFTKFQFDLVSN